MKISVIIPVYNVAKYIARCIDSVLNQSLQDFEVILVNDASTDGSTGIITQYARSDNRFVIVDNEQNMGPMWARRAGYVKAKGDYIIFCDSDDYLLPDALSTLYRAIVSSGADIVASSFVRKMPNADKIIQNKLSYGNDSDSVYRSLLAGEFYHSLCAKIFKASLFKNYSYETIVHQTNGEDAMLFYQILRNANRIEVISVPTYCYVFNAFSSTVNITAKKAHQILFVQQWCFNFLKSNKNVYDFLIKETLYTRSRILRYLYITKENLFPEKELRPYLSLKGLLSIFSLKDGLLLYLILHFSIVSNIMRMKYKIYVKRIGKQ